MHMTPARPTSAMRAMSAECPGTGLSRLDDHAARRP